MNAGGGNADQGVAGADILACDQVFFVRGAHRESRQVILVFRIEAGHLCGLAADQGSACLLTPVTYALDDLGDLLGEVFAAGNVIEEKERFAARAGYIVDTHGNAVDADSVVSVHQESEFEFCPDAVCSGQKNGIFHLLDLGEGEGARKASESSHHFGAHCLCDICFHQFYASISGFDIDTGALIIHHVQRVSLCTIFMYVYGSIAGPVCESCTAVPQLKSLLLRAENRSARQRAEPSAGRKTRFNEPLSLFNNSYIRLPAGAHPSAALLQADAVRNL